MLTLSFHRLALMGVNQQNETEEMFCFSLSFLFVEGGNNQYNNYFTACGNKMAVLLCRTLQD